MSRDLCGIGRCVVLRCHLHHIATDVGVTRTLDLLITKQLLTSVIPHGSIGVARNLGSTAWCTLVEKTYEHKETYCETNGETKGSDQASEAESAHTREPAEAFREIGYRIQGSIADLDVQNLDKIEHIVVLMMENRSFDQMLGYLKLEKSRSDVNGLTAGLSNTYKGKRYEIYLQTNTKLRSDQEPCHDGGCVAEQLDNNNGGFVKNYAETQEGDPDVGLVMGYFNETALPTHDHIAEEFAVCDQWYASVPGATWPNRLYAVAGRTAGSKDNPSGLPRYYLSSFVGHLDAKGVSWKWYAYPLWNPFGGILTTLQMTDDKYNASDAGNYAYCDPDFFDDAANGRLAAVTWINPNFGYPMHEAYENDDHPPADVVAGQELSLKVYHAITQGPLWEKSLLLIVYDEHGGFYDHVHPIRAPDDDPFANMECASRSSYRLGSSEHTSLTTATTTPRSSRRSCCASAGLGTAFQAWGRA
jgi:phospholipase C